MACMQGRASRPGPPTTPRRLSPQMRPATRRPLHTCTACTRKRSCCPFPPPSSSSRPSSTQIQRPPLPHPVPTRRSLRCFIGTFRNILNRNGSNVFPRARLDAHPARESRVVEARRSMHAYAGSGGCLHRACGAGATLHACSMRTQAAEAAQLHPSATSGLRTKTCARRPSHPRRR